MIWINKWWMNKWWMKWWMNEWMMMNDDDMIKMNHMNNEW